MVDLALAKEAFCVTAGVFEKRNVLPKEIGGDTIIVEHITIDPDLELKYLEELFWRVGIDRVAPGKPAI